MGSVTKQTNPFLSSPSQEGRDGLDRTAATPPPHPPTPDLYFDYHPLPPCTTTLEKSPTPLKSKTTPFHAPLLTWSSQRSHFHFGTKLLVLPSCSLATSCWCTCQWRTAGSTLRALQLPGSNAARGRPAPSLFYSQPHYYPAPNSGRPFPVLFLLVSLQFSPI